jgi:hypothetical protein
MKFLKITTLLVYLAPESTSKIEVTYQQNIKTVPTFFLSRVISPFIAMVKKFSTLGVTLQPELKTGMIYSKWEK